MDANHIDKQPKNKTEDYFPGASGAWSNAWCMEPQSFTPHEEERHSDFHDHEEPESGWDTARS